ncbi:alpha-hydroxy-acid oxidizing protein [Nocardia suismassiliense]|uniref:Alpha-hydroxy-acid oxidizing protein n=1 Tax=Nocardia suismassiliense TaxID=2077092 RepID=A0ABW6QVC6_9NOCA
MSHATGTEATSQAENQPGDHPGHARQEAIFRPGAFGHKPAVPTNFTDLERAACRRMSKQALAYLVGGAGDGATMDNNRRALDRWAIVPRMLRDTSQRSLRTELFGRVLPAPVLVAPIGAGALVHRKADVHIGAAAAALGMPYIFSNQGSAPMEQTAAEMDRVAAKNGRAHAPRWFQLYYSTDEALVDSLIGRAEAIGAEALVVTPDTTQLGWRPQDLNIGSLPFSRAIGIDQYTSDPRFAEMVDEHLAAARRSGERPKTELTLGGLRTLLAMSRNMPGNFLRNLVSPVPRAAVETFLATYSRPSLNWQDIAGLRARTTLPILLKGIQHPDDARKAVELGIDGIMVSNHGGRQVDGGIGAADALIDIVAAVGDRTTIVFDSGIRGGADVFKALALGADAVTIGRPHMYALVLAGRSGVQEVLENFIAELDLTLGLTGFSSIAELSPEALRRIR